MKNITKKLFNSMKGKQPPYMPQGKWLEENPKDKYVKDKMKTYKKNKV